MDSQGVPLLSWAYLHPGKGIDELMQSLWLTTMELESIRIKAEEELKTRDGQLFELKELLNQTIKERDEAQEQCQTLFLEKFLIQQQQQQQQQQLMSQVQQQNHQNHQSAAPLSGISSIEDEPIRGVDSNNGFSSSDCEESIVSSPMQHQENPQAQPVNATTEQDPILPILADRPLPEKGKLLQAVMKAGPLLQTLLLAGPLPQWRHPPPPLDSHQIPPPPVFIPSPPTPPPPPPPAPTLPASSFHQDSLLSIASYHGIINNCGRVNRKRVLCEGSDSSSESKYQRIVLQ